MPILAILFGLVVGFFVWTHLFLVLGPILAVFNLAYGRFFVAAVLMAIGLWCGTWVWMDDPTPFVVEPEIYKVLLGFGLALEGAKWVIKQRGGIQRALRDQRELSWLEKWEGKGIVINIEEEDEEPPMKDVTPRRDRGRYLSSGSSRDQA
jgi:hypothetical protein